MSAFTAREANRRVGVRSANDEMLRWRFRTHEAKGADPKTEPQRKGADPRTGPSQNVNGETSVRLPPCPFWPRLSGSPGACRWCVVLRLVVFGFLLRLCAVLAPGFCVVLFCVPGFDFEFKVERAPSPEPSIAGRYTQECRRCCRYGIGWLFSVLDARRVYSRLLPIHALKASRW